MSLISAIQAIKTIHQSSDFVNQQEAVKNKVKNMLNGLQKAITFLLEKRALIDRYITQAEIVVTRLKEFLSK